MSNVTVPGNNKTNFWKGFWTNFHNIMQLTESKNLQTDVYSQVPTGSLGESSFFLVYTHHIDHHRKILNNIMCVLCHVVHSAHACDKTGRLQRTPLTEVNRFTPNCKVRIGWRVGVKGVIIVRVKDNTLTQPQYTPGNVKDPLWTEPVICTH